MLEGLLKSEVHTARHAESIQAQPLEIGQSQRPSSKKTHNFVTGALTGNADLCGGISAMACHSIDVR